jgi:8-oxo-dGTP diphosphatase
MFLFDGGATAAGTQFSLPADELRSAAFVSIDEVDGLLSPVLARRLREAVRALRRGVCCYLEDGCPIA